MLSVAVSESAGDMRPHVLHSMHDDVGFNESPPQPTRDGTTALAAIRDYAVCTRSLDLSELPSLSSGLVFDLRAAMCW
jgi:hypothetical protein